MSIENHPLGPLAPLADTPQWVVVRLVPQPDGKTDKIPLNFITGQACSAHEPQNWTTFEAAIAVAHHRGLQTVPGGPGHAVGFVLTTGAGWTCIDLDKAALPDGTNWHPLALQVIDELPGAVLERSQSGAGLHLWCRHPSPPAHISKRIDLAVGLEAYTEARFMVIGTQQRGQLADRCEALPAFLAKWFPPRPKASAEIPDEGPCEGWDGHADDVALIEAARRSQSAGATFGDGVTFADLFDCNEHALAKRWPSSSGDSFDRSSADFSLASRLAFWTGRDVARIARLMLMSKLARSKWDRDDYFLERTIRGACRTVRDVHNRVGRPAALATAKPEASARMTYKQAASDLAAANTAEWTDKWLALALAMSTTDRHRFLEEASYRTGIGKRAMSATLKQAVLKTDSERARAGLQDRAAGRRLVPYRDDQFTGMAVEIDSLIAAHASPGGYVLFGGALSKIEVCELPFTHATDGDAPPPAVAQLKPISTAEAFALAEEVAVLVKEHPDRPPKPVTMPERLIAQLVQQGRQSVAPRVNGLLAHPVVLPDGEILSQPGLHAASRLFLTGDTVAGLRAFNQAEAHQALDWLRANVLEGFEFASPAHVDAALAGLMTGIQRRLLPAAPGLAILANTQSSGKTSLASTIHTMLTGRNMPALSLALGDEAEIKKALVGTLERNPAMVCFDNVADGATLSSAALAAVMTSPEWNERKLGGNQPATLSTAVLLVATGNNLALGPDEVSRWLVARLEPKTARPQERRFRHPDVHRHALAIRADALRCVLGIVAGYLQSGMATDATPSRFPGWDTQVARPLRWAGGADVAAGFRENMQASPTEQALGATVLALAEAYGDRWFSAGEVATLAALGTSGALREALDFLGVRNFTAKAVANLLRSKAGRPVEIRGNVTSIGHKEDSHNKRMLYRVQKCG